MINDTHSIQESGSGSGPPQSPKVGNTIPWQHHQEEIPTSQGLLGLLQRLQNSGFHACLVFQKLNTNCLGSHFEEGASPGKQKEYFSWMLYLFSLSPTLMTQGLMRPREWAALWKPADFPTRHWQATDHMPHVPFIQLWGWVTSSRLHSYQGAKLV